MKNKPVIITMLGGFLLTFVAVSNVGAEEMTWLNTHKFIAGENDILSHSSPGYPGSITVQPINNNEVTVEGDDEPIPSEIIKRFKMREEYKLTSISICLRNYGEAHSFAIRIFKLGVPTEDTGTVGLDLF